MEPTHISELAHTLHNFFSWNKSRINCLSHILLGLFVVRTVNLAELATTFSGSAKTDSNYKRLQRFLAWLSKKKCYQELVLRLIINQIGQKKLILSMDRTNWKFRGNDINILVLGVWYQGVSIPLLWFCLSHGGCSTAQDKIKIIKNVLKNIPAEKIDYLLADREFIGEEWFKFLIGNGIRFSIRIKDLYNIKVFNRGFYKTMKVKQAFADIKKKNVVKKAVLFGCEVSLVACMSSEGDFVVIVTNSRYPKRALKVYKLRWSIESLFACLKGRGFNFEDTHLAKSDRIESLVFVLALATFWSMKTGIYLTKTEPLKSGTHGRPRKSIFRLGLDMIRRCIIQVLEQLQQLLKMISLIVTDQIEATVRLL